MLQMVLLAWRVMRVRVIACDRACAQGIYIWNLASKCTNDLNQSSNSEDIIIKPQASDLQPHAPSCHPIPLQFNPPFTAVTLL